MGLKRNLTHFCIAELCNCLKNPHRSWLAHMSFQLKVNGFGLPAKWKLVFTLRFPPPPFWNTTRPWRRVYMDNSDPSPLPNPPPTPPLFSGIVYLLSFVMASRKIHFKEEKKFWIVDVLFIYIYQSMTWISAFEAAEKHKIMSLKRKSLFNIFCMIGDFDVTLLKIIAQINIQALGFSKIHIFCSLIRIFDRCSSLEHFAGNEEKTLRITSTRSENKNSKPIFLLQLTFPYSIQAVKLGNIICWWLFICWNL